MDWTDALQIAKIVAGTLKSKNNYRNIKICIYIHAHVYKRERKKNVFSLSGFFT
jgi:hypothetical protein